MIGSWESVDDTAPNTLFLGENIGKMFIGHQEEDRQMLAYLVITKYRAAMEVW